MSTSQPDPFQELVNLLRCSLMNPSTTPVTAPITSSPHTVVASPMANPAPYSGSMEECNGFLLQCSLTLEMQPQRFSTESAKIAYIISLLTGRALQWAETSWQQSGPGTQSVNVFMNYFREGFGKPVGHTTICDQLYNLKQVKLSTTDYALKFCSSQWME